MTRSDPPRLAVALLRRVLDDNEPLAGDLLERFAAGQSRLWFWREVLAAVAVRALQQRARERAIRRQVNLTASPIPGMGGLGLVALGALVSLVRPWVLWMLVPALAGGVALGFTIALLRRRSLLSGPVRSSRILSDL